MLLGDARAYRYAANWIADEEIVSEQGACAYRYAAKSRGSVCAGQDTSTAADVTKRLKSCYGKVKHGRCLLRTRRRLISLRPVGTNPGVEYRDEP